MTQKNQDFVAIDEGFDCLWRFTIQPNIDSSDNSLQDSLEPGKILFETFNSFIRPYELKCGYTTDTTDISNSDRLGIEHGESEVSWEAISSSVPLSWTELRTHITTNVSSDSMIVTAFDIEKSDVFTTLSSGDSYISRNSPLCKRWKSGKVHDSQPWFDPLSVKLRVSPPWIDVIDGLSYRISLESHTELWFEEHSIGRKNRYRLAAFLQRISENFNVVKTEYRSNRYSADNLEDFLSES